MEKRSSTPRAQAKLDAINANIAAHYLADNIRILAYQAAQNLVQAAQDALGAARANAAANPFTGTYAVVYAAEAVLAPLLLVKTASQNVADTVRAQSYGDANAACVVAINVANTYADTN